MAWNEANGNTQKEFAKEKRDEKKRYVSPVIVIELKSSDVSELEKIKK